jgi:hypothetical protein
MKYRLIIILFSIVACTHASAQSEFEAGFLAGFAATQVDGDGVSGFNKIGATGGFFVTASFSDRLAGRMELTYVGKGSRKPADPDNGDFSTWGYTFHYIEVPLVLEYHLDAFYLHGGVYGGVLVNGSQFQDGASYDVVNPEMRPYDFGVAAGAGYDITEKFFAQARFTSSVIPIRQPPDPGNQTRWYDGGMSNIVVQFSLGLRLGS